MEDIPRKYRRRFYKEHMLTLTIHDAGVWIFKKTVMRFTCTCGLIYVDMVAKDSNGLSEHMTRLANDLKERHIREVTAGYNDTSEYNWQRLFWE